MKIEERKNNYCVLMLGLTNFDILRYVDRVDLPHFRGVYMKDMLPKSPLERECGIVNFNTSHEPGSHWVCYYKDGSQRIYFDSFGQVTPMEIQQYLKTKREFEENMNVIQRNTDIVQRINSSDCGHLCLIVLSALSKGVSFQVVINTLRQRYDGYT